MAIARAKGLTEAQCESLTVLASEPGDGWLLPRWFAEALKRYDQTAWARARLKALSEKGLAEISGDNCYYRITPAGRLALQEADPASRSSQKETGDGDP